MKISWRQPEFFLPDGNMDPLGYVVQQHGVRLGRPIKAYDKWVNRMPKEYAETLKGQKSGPYSSAPYLDQNCLGTIKHYRSLIPMAQEVRKPIFALTYADGAIGGHSSADREAYKNFRRLAMLVCDKIGLENEYADS